MKKVLCGFPPPAPHLFLAFKEEIKRGRMREQRRPRNEAGGKVSAFGAALIFPGLPSSRRSRAAHNRIHLNVHLEGQSVWRASATQAAGSCTLQDVPSLRADSKTQFSSAPGIEMLIASWGTKRFRAHALGPVDC